MRIGGRTRYRRYDASDQFAPELLYFSNCILNDREPEPSGEEGLADIRIIEALRKSMKSGRWVTVDVGQRARRPTLRQAISRPPVKMPNLVNAASPAAPP